MIRGVYPILDVGPLVRPERAAEVVDQLLDGGAKILQLRGKKIDAGPMFELTKALLPRCKTRGAALIVNDRPDIALAAGADGVHLGQDDLPAAEVRRWLPASMIIGVSCHDIGQLERAMKSGAANYLAYGPIFATHTKERPDPVVGLDGLTRARALAQGVPLVAIGGITLDRLPRVRDAGADAAAMISALLGAPDVKAATRAAIAAFERA